MRYPAVLALAAYAATFRPAAAVAQERFDSPPASPRFGAQVYALASTGWTVREIDRIENRVTDVELSTGGGMGALISYDFSRRIAGYAAAELGVEQEGVYGSYGAGVLLRTGRNGSVRFHGRVGARIIDVVTSLAYADLGVGGDVFIAPTLALGVDLGASLPLGGGSRDTGTHRVEVSPEGGPERVSLGLAWYPAR